MTRQEFMKGWILLTSQPWGMRYADNTPAAQTQLALYFDAFSHMNGDEWQRVCRHLAGGDRWPSLDRIGELQPTMDRHPGCESAWARLAPSLKNESLTVCWTEEMAQAFGVALGLADDPIAARMAFKESYEALVEQAQAQGKKPKWSVSLGWDKNGREPVIAEAVRQGLISYTHGQKLYPSLPPPNDGTTGLVRLESV